MSVGNTLKERSVYKSDNLVLRKPRLEDGAKIHALVKSCKPLDVNSVYTYLLLCQHFADTCVVAEVHGKVVGFLSGYVLPPRRDVFFVWQIAVDERWRGKSFGKRLLRDVLQRAFCRDCCFLETTISPSNNASWGLFRSFVKDLAISYEECSCFSEEYFGQERHEAEHLFRIGPFDVNWVK